MSNMPLENLPEYLKSHKNGQTSAPVVEMGSIEIPKSNKPKWIALILTCLILTTGGIFYNLNQNDTITINVSQSELKELTQLAANDGKVLDVNPTDDTYDVKISLRKNKGAILEWLKNHKKRD